MTTDNPTGKYWLCPLYSFDCDSKSVDLIDGIQIKRIPREFETYLMKQYSDWWWVDPSETNYMLVLPQSIVKGDKIKSMFDWTESKKLVDTITAFRLCHAGMVTPGPLVPAKLENNVFSVSQFDDIVEGVEVGPILTPISKEGADLFEGPHYEFLQSDVPLVSELVNRLVRLRDKKEPDNLSIALGRFNTSYHGSLENRLLDHMIAFEFLYLGYDPELKYRLALRIAFFLGKDNEDEREDIFSKMSKAYKLRSDIVHGNKQVERGELEEIVPETEEYLRQSIRKFLLLLSQGHSLKKLREKLLDENILKNGALLA